MPFFAASLSNDVWMWQSNFFYRHRERSFFLSFSVVYRNFFSVLFLFFVLYSFSFFILPFLFSLIYFLYTLEPRPFRQSLEDNSMVLTGCELNSNSAAGLRIQVKIDRIRTLVYKTRIRTRPSKKSWFQVWNWTLGNWTIKKDWIKMLLNKIYLKLFQKNWNGITLL